MSNCYYYNYRLLLSSARYYNYTSFVIYIFLTGDINNFICLVLGAVQGHYCYVGSSLVVVRGLLAAAAPRCGAWALGRVGSVAAAPGLESTGSVVVARA